MNNLVYLKDIVTLVYDEGKCTGCGLCREVCPHNVFGMNGKRVFIRDRDACMECGACSRNCAFGALSVQTGVGCAAAVIHSLVSRKDTGGCCPPDISANGNCGKSTGCC
ncbi:MAG: NADP-reducing hydrogenase subunit HndC [Syntrophaceae bacterium PtaU1.Bin231]|nr:MAG: NADP-reducing hydrogenase subunit HndC [Syntrophaceae bacterium PtaU1.Bin231]